MNENYTDTIQSDYQIEVNFLPTADPIPPFQAYRRLTSGSEGKPNDDSIWKLKLPKQPGDDGDWDHFFISFNTRRGYDPFTVSAAYPPQIHLKALQHALINAATQHLPEDDFIVPRDTFYTEVHFVIKRHQEGLELVTVQPYFMRATHSYGYLFDRHFRKNAEVPFDRRVQQLSLALDARFRRNLNMYIDRTKRVELMLQTHRHLFETLQLPDGTTFRLRNSFESLPSKTLDRKIFIFGNHQESESQFGGLKQYGPLEPVSESPRLLFIFRENDRIAARLLARNLKGLTNQFTFPGFKQLFGCDLNFDPHPVVIHDFSPTSLELALERAKLEKQTFPLLIPILVIPEEHPSYLIYKSLFSHAEIPTQVCTLRLLADDNSLRWAIANLALQIFCKAGGMPWKVKPTGRNTLIVGISQSHKSRLVKGRVHVDKYVAFSVLTDNSGIFNRIQILSDAPNLADHIDQLQHALSDVLQTNSAKFSQIVIHASFKMKRREMDAIQRTVKESAKRFGDKCAFAVLKLNQNSRFFGVNRQLNSLVPFEATVTDLGSKEFLVWFEGVSRKHTTVTKAYPRPTHVQIMRVTNREELPADVLLQDLVNLSGANWRGFNARSAPVSVFYCQLVAKLIRQFHEHGLPMPAIKDLKPWFL